MVSDYIPKIVMMEQYDEYDKVKSVNFFDSPDEAVEMVQWLGELMANMEEELPVTVHPTYWKIYVKDELWKTYKWKCGKGAREPFVHDGSRPSHLS